MGLWSDGVQPTSSFLMVFFVVERFSKKIGAVLSLSYKPLPLDLVPGTLLDLPRVSRSVWWFINLATSIFV